MRRKEKWTAHNDNEVTLEILAAGWIFGATQKLCARIQVCSVTQLLRCMKKMVRKRWADLTLSTERMRAENCIVNDNEIWNFIMLHVYLNGNRSKARCRIFTGMNKYSNQIEFIGETNWWNAEVMRTFVYFAFCPCGGINGTICASQANRTSFSSTFVTSFDACENITHKATVFSHILFHFILTTRNFSLNVVWCI